MSAVLPSGMARYTVRQKLNRKRQIESVLRNAPVSLDSYLVCDAARRQRARGLVMKLVMNALAQDADTRMRSFFDDCERATDQCIRDARAFDPLISEVDIHQALRNLWVFNSIQFAMGYPVSLSPAPLAYSLLYPYTDNWLDAGRHSHAESDSFVQWLSLRLEGLRSGMADGHRAAVNSLLQMIEGSYPRSEFPLVHQSLLAIHSAQRNALLLRAGAEDAGETRLLSLTVEKGGTSVLADAFLVSGDLDPDQMDAFFAYGVLLQLVDDLEDVCEDIGKGHSSPFTRAAQQDVLEGCTSRLLNFIGAIVAVMQRRLSPRAMPVCELIARSCTLMAQEAVARQRRFYSEGYLQALEESSPLRFSDLGELRERLGERSEARWIPAALAG